MVRAVTEKQFVESFTNPAESIGSDELTATQLAASSVGSSEIADDAVEFENLDKAYVAKQVAATLSASGATTVAVTFGETFAAAPVVIACVNDAAGTTAQIGAGSITTTGANLYITDASDTTVTVTVGFIAAEA